MSVLDSKQVKNLRWGVTAVLGFGIVTSVGANLLHTVVQPAASSFPWWKLGFALFLAAFAPLALFACIEMSFRIPVVSKVLGWIRLGLTVLIGGFAGWVSYWHMVAISVLLGEDDGIAEYVYPLVVDGMMAVATISAIAVGQLARKVVEKAAQVEASAPRQRKLDPDVAKARAEKAKVTKERNKAKAAATEGRPSEEGLTSQETVERELMQAFRDYRALTPYERTKFRKAHGAPAWPGTPEFDEAVTAKVAQLELAGVS